MAQPLRLGVMAEEGKVDLSSVRLLVLDEADKLFDMGFTEQVRQRGDKGGGGKGKWGIAGSGKREGETGSGRGERGCLGECWAGWHGGAGRKWGVTALACNVNNQQQHQQQPPLTHPACPSGRPALPTDRHSDCGVHPPRLRACPVQRHPARGGGGAGAQRAEGPPAHHCGRAQHW
jgi:hypothetical protein